MGGRDGLPLIAVHTDAEGAALLRDLCECAVAGVAAGTEDDVGTLVEDLLRVGRAPVGIVERVVAGRVVDADGLDGRVGVLGAVLPALGVGHDRRNGVGADDGADRIGLREQACERACHEAGLVLVEHEAGEVVNGRALELVHADELQRRIGLGRLDGVVTEGEADRDDHLVAVVDELLDVGGVVGLGVALDVLGLHANGRGTLLGALPCRLVERLVVDLAEVGDETDAQRVGGLAVDVRGIDGGDRVRRSCCGGVRCGGRSGVGGGCCGRLSCGRGSGVGGGGHGRFSCGRCSGVGGLVLAACGYDEDAREQCGGDLCGFHRSLPGWVGGAGGA